MLPRTTKRRRGSDGGAGEVYLAAPITTYQTGQYDRALRWLRTNYPRITIISAREEFRDGADWRARGHGVLSRCNALVFITDNGVIGRGVDNEIACACARTTPVFMLMSDLRLVPHYQLHFTSPNAGDWRRYRRVMVKGASYGT